MIIIIQNFVIIFILFVIVALTSCMNLHSLNLTIDSPSTSTHKQTTCYQLYQNFTEGKYLNSKRKLKLRSIKFRLLNTKFKSAFCILVRLKLTTLTLLCHCRMSSISVLYLFEGLMFFGYFAALQPGNTLFHLLMNVYFIRFQI